MKRLLLIAALVGLGCACPLSPAYAQQQPQSRPAGMSSQVNLLQLPPALQAKLKLTADQKGKIAGIRKKLAETSAAVAQEVEKGGERRAAVRKDLAARQAAETEAEAALTDAQKSSFAGMKEQVAQWRGLGRAATALVAVEGLTEDQKGKLKALAAETAAKAREILRGEDRRASLRKVQAMQMETEESVKKLLTADQVKQFESVWAPLRLPTDSNNP